MLVEFYIGLAGQIYALDPDCYPWLVFFLPTGYIVLMYVLIPFDHWTEKFIEEHERRQVEEQAKRLEADEGSLTTTG